MSEKKQRTQTPDVEVSNTGPVQPKNQPQVSSFECKISNIKFRDKTLFPEFVAQNVIMDCEVCKKKFCGYKKYREHETKCNKRQKALGQIKDMMSTNTIKDWNSKKAEDAKNIVKEVVKKDGTTDFEFELPHAIVMRQENNTQKQSTKNGNTPIEMERHLQPLPKNVLTSFKMTLESQNSKNIFQKTEMNKVAEMDTIEIIGQSTIRSNNHEFEFDNAQTFINKMHTSKTVQEIVDVKHIPSIIPITKIVESIPKVQTSTSKNLFPITATKNDPNLGKPWYDLIKISPNPPVKESKTLQRQTQTTSSIEHNICLGKGMPIQNFLVQSRNNFKKVTNQMNVGQSIIKPTRQIPQPAKKELYRPSKPEYRASPLIFEDVAKHQSLLEKVITPNQEPMNAKNNIQAILKRKELLPGSNKHTLAFTPILNLPINVRKLQVKKLPGGQVTEKCIFLTPANTLGSSPQTVTSTRVKEQASLLKKVNNLAKSPRTSNQVQSHRTVLMKPVKKNMNDISGNENKIETPIKNPDKSDSSILHTFNVPHASNAVETAPNLRITATDTLIPTSHTLSKVQDNLKKKDINTTDNKDELKEMLMDENELNQLLLLAEKIKQSSPKTLQNNPKLVQSVASSETKVDKKNQILNENTTKREIKTEPLDEDMENNLILMQELEAAIVKNKRNNDCPKEDKATTYSTVPSDVNSFEPKVENIDCEESNPENLYTNENKDLPKQNLIPLENIVSLTKEKSREQIAAPIFSNIPLTTDTKNNTEKDPKILPVNEVNKTIGVQNLITNSKTSSQSIQRSINESFGKETDISQKSNGNDNSTAKHDSINSCSTDDDIYEVETLDEDLLESEEFLQNNKKTVCDQEVIEILDDSDLSDVDPEILDTVKKAIKSTGIYVEKPPLHCQKCELTFCSYTSIGRHLSSDHKRRFCFCKICNSVKEKANKISLISILEHKKITMKNQTQNYIFYCEVCQQRFNNVVSFSRHRSNCTMKRQNTKVKLAVQCSNTTKHPLEQSFEIHNNVNISKLKEDDGKNVIKRICTNVDSEQRKTNEQSDTKCNFCGNVYSTFHSRLRHEAGYCRKNVNMVKKEDKLYPCERCNKQFASTMSRHFHMKMYCYDKNQVMKFECSKCDKKFPLYHMLQRHFVIRHVHIYYCDYCQRSFSDKHHLTRHIFGHMGLKPFKCNICSQKFTRKCKLQVHLQRHSNKKDYDCKICNKQFMFKNLLKKHMNINCSEENIKKNPLLCDICKKRYKDKKHIEKHMINMHVKKFPCNVCDKVFGQKFKLNLHLATHGKKYFCSICKKPFVSKHLFLRHKASHFDYSCECGQKFNLRYDYYRHRTYWCVKTAGKPIDEIVNNDALLSETKKKNTKTKSKKQGSIKKDEKKKKKETEDKVYGNKSNEIEDGKKNDCGDGANITEPVIVTDSEDDYCLQKFVTAKIENKTSDIEINEEAVVIRDIKKILRKRKSEGNSLQEVSTNATITKEHNKTNENQNNSLEQFGYPVLVLTDTNETRNNKTTNKQTITTRNKVYLKQKGQFKKNDKVLSKNVGKKKRIVISKNKKMKRDNTTASKRR